jgi:glutaconyl-CoA decarboxylase
MVGLSSIGAVRPLRHDESDPVPVALADLDGLALRPTIAPPPTVEAAVSHATRAAEGGQTISAPMPGTILAVRVTQGEQVEAHQVLVLLEAMKMENAVTAPVAATVRGVLVKAGQTVSRGEALIELA